MPKLRFRVAALAIPLLVGGVGVAACGSSAKTSSPSTTTVAPSTKAAFCAGNTTLVKASPHLARPAGLLTALETNTAALDRMANNIPNDPAIRAHAQTLIAAGRAALDTNDASVLRQHSLMATWAKVDAYCGVDGTGSPLPSYFGHGKGFPACTSFLALDRGVRSAASPQDAVAFLKANETKVNDLAADALHRAEGAGAQALLPAETLVTAVRTAIRTNDGTPLYTPKVITAATNANSFCGVNT